ncbi:MAG: beta-ketoacyl synthase N-terminal-like domain-containing protein, partial [Rhodospirillaceae bacterium]
SADYAQLLRTQGEINAYYLTGNPLNAASGRLSHSLGFHGPSLSLDTACSSSAMALHTAIGALRAGDCDLALAGGVNLMLVPDGAVILSKAGMIAPDGRCKTFDAGANGYGRGEGCGLVVLKRLSDAQRDGDRIRALILGSAATQDGPASGFTVPNGAAQRQAIEKACRAAGVAPADVDYAELHGTGTPLGDPIEVNALAAAYGPNRAADRPLLLGAVKSNIGHLESAAGVAGLIKTVLCLQEAKLPANLHLKTPNPEIAWEALPVAPVRENQSWPAKPDRAGIAPDGAGETRRLAGVSSFGASGTNVHMVLSNAPDLADPVDPADLAETTDPAIQLPEVLVLCLSAATKDGLKRLALAWADQIEADCQSGQQGHETAKRRIARWSAAGSSLEYRMAVLGAPSQIAEALRQGKELPNLWQGRLPAAGAPPIGLAALEDGAQPSPLHLLFPEAELATPADSLDPDLLWLVPEGWGPVSLQENVISLSDPLEAAAMAYIRGALPVWQVLWPGVMGVPERPPSYPFARTRHWLPQKPQPEPLPGASKDDAAVAQTPLPEVPSAAPDLEATQLHSDLLRIQREGVERAVKAVLERQTAHLLKIKPRPASAATAASAASPKTPDPAKPWLPIVLCGQSDEDIERDLAALARDPVGQAERLRQTVPPSGHAGPAAVLLLRDANEAPAILADAKRAKSRLWRGQRPQRAPKLAYLYPGLGDHYLGMGRALASWSPAGYGAAFTRACAGAAVQLGDNPESRVFAEETKSAAEAVPGTTPSGKLDLRAMMAAARGQSAVQESPEAAALNQTPIAHSAILATELALTTQLAVWGIAPDLVMGYSLGEYAAAVAAEVMSAEAAMALVVERARLIEQAPPGGMLAVPLSEQQILPFLAGTDCALAVQSTPMMSVIAGPTEALQLVANKMKEKRILSRKLTARAAFHTPSLAGVAEPLAALAAAQSFAEPQRTMVSTLTGRALGPKAPAPQHWVDHTLGCVRFTDGLTSLFAGGAEILLEVGPGRSLTSFVHQHPGPAPSQSASSQSAPSQSEQALPGSLPSASPLALACMRGAEE